MSEVSVSIWRLKFLGAWTLQLHFYFVDHLQRESRKEELTAIVEANGFAGYKSPVYCYDSYLMFI